MSARVLFLRTLWSTARVFSIACSPLPPCSLQVATPRHATFLQRRPVDLANAPHSRRLVRPGLNADLIREIRQLIFPEPDVLPISRHTLSVSTVADWFRQLRQFSIPYRDGEQLSRRLSTFQDIRKYHHLRPHSYSATDQKNELSQPGAVDGAFTICRELSRCRRLLSASGPRTTHLRTVANCRLLAPPTKTISRQRFRRTRPSVVKCRGAS